MKDGDVCEIECIHYEEVDRVKSAMLDDAEFLNLSDLFKIFGDSTRVKILFALSQRELCVCDLAAVLNISQSAVSHQLRLMRANNLVKFRKKGKMAYYSLADEHVVKLIEMGVEHAREIR
jgi:DNA-binding transcriptional ArsR family regulator